MAPVTLMASIGGDQVPSPLPEIDHIGDRIRCGDDPLGDGETEGQVGVVTGSAHDHRQWGAVETDLERLFHHQVVVESGNALPDPDHLS
jgi:hypothetical protein